MKQTYNTINYEWLIKPIGDPFSDVGGYVIKYLSEQNPEKDILELIEYIAKIYVNKWDAKINPFFLNSAITQPAFKGNKKTEETVKFYKSLIDETAPCEIGFCRMSGMQTKLFRAGRDNSLMSGSGTFVNFHHSFQFGLMLSKEMLIRMLFVPYGTIFIGGRLAIIQTNDSKVNDFFVKQNCKSNDGNIATNSGGGVLKSDYGIPANAIFHFVDDLFVNQLQIATDNSQDLSITLYHFTNFGASPEIIIYALPSTVFRFYSTCQSIELKSDWLPFLMAHYTNSRHKGAKFNQSTLKYGLVKKNESEEFAFDDYKTWRNLVLENLLNGKSILRMLLKWGTTHKFNFAIIEIYQKYVRNMKQETLNKIKELAQFLTNTTDVNSIKKTISSLDGYKSPYELRRFFLKRVVKPNYDSGAKETKITVEELINYLFPDDISWRDIRDILLFAIYQELHAKNIQVETELNEEETTDEN